MNKVVYIPCMNDVDISDINMNLNFYERNDVNSIS